MWGGEVYGVHVSVLCCVYKLCVQGMYFDMIAAIKVMTMMMCMMICTANKQKTTQKKKKKKKKMMMMTIPTTITTAELVYLVDQILQSDVQ